jgi:hypothetical protein
LIWERAPGAESCVSAPRLAQALEQQLGYPLSSEDPELVVHGKVAPLTSPTRFRAEVVLLDAQGRALGRRVVETPAGDCNALNDALVLVVALAVDAHVAQKIEAPPLPPPLPPAEPESEPAPAPPPAPPPPPQAPAPAPTPPAPAPEPERAPRLRVVHTTRSGSSRGLVLSGGAGLATGMMPSLTWSASLTLGWRTPHKFSFELAAMAFPMGSRPTSDGDARFRAGYAELRACAPLFTRVIFVDACAGLWNGILHAGGHGFSAGSDSHLVPLSGATGQARVAWEFTERWFARLSAGAGVPFVRDRFVAQGTQGAKVELHQLDPALFLSGLELGLRLR